MSCDDALLRLRQCQTQNSEAVCSAHSQGRAADVCESAVRAAQTQCSAGNIYGVTRVASTYRDGLNQLCNVDLTVAKSAAQSAAQPAAQPPAQPMTGH